jgi:2-dehydropantoate 2-reductase
MRVVVYGAGAVGGVIAGRLFQAGTEVIAIARGAHFEALRDHGLRLVDPDADVTLPVPVADAPNAIDWQPDDVVLLAMKTQDTTDALAALAAVAPPTIGVVCAQNGVENERLALRRFARVYPMCVMLPASHLEPGVVEASSAPISGLLDVGCYPSGVDDTARAVAGALTAATFESVPRADIMRWKYRKLLMNLGNAIEALCRPSEAVGELARRARTEGNAALAAAGIDAAAGAEDRERRGTLLTPRLARGGGSSWQSLERGTGRIEADYLNGEITLLGRLHGVPTPVNALLQRLANETARNGDPPGSRDASDLVRMLANDA